MIQYLLDTNICIYLIKKQPEELIKKLSALDISTIGISSITLSELEYGISKSAFPQKNRMALAEFLVPFQIYSYDDKASSKYGDIRASLEKQGRVIGPLDMLIAAHALSLDCILVTNNVKEFERVDALPIENWVN